MQAKWWRFFPLLLLLMAALVVWRHGQDPQPAGVQTLSCPDLRQGCSAHLGRQEVAVRVVGELKPLQPFTLRVTAPKARKVEARFTMEGMDMGFNLYTLRAEAEGVFQSRITLPVCVTGRRDWVMELSLDGERLTVPFVTDL
jgi:hypothetical protein